MSGQQILFSLIKDLSKVPNAMNLAQRVEWCRKLYTCLDQLNYLFDTGISSQFTNLCNVLSTGKYEDSEYVNEILKLYLKDKQKALDTIEIVVEEFSDKNVIVERLISLIDNIKNPIVI